jgi:hypothetical protein
MKGLRIETEEAQKPTGEICVALQTKVADKLLDFALTLETTNAEALQILELDEDETSLILKGTKRIRIEKENDWQTIDYNTNRILLERLCKMKKNLITFSLLQEARGSISIKTAQFVEMISESEAKPYAIPPMPQRQAPPKRIAKK